MVCSLFVQTLNLFLLTQQQFYYHLEKKQVQTKEETGKYDHLLVSSLVRKSRNSFKEEKKEFVDQEA